MLCDRYELFSIWLIQTSFSNIFYIIYTIVPMMKKTDDGYILFDTIYIGSGVKPNNVDLALRLEQWADVVYSKEIMIVDYPGEYELLGYSIIAFLTKNQKTLNYLIRFGNKRVAYIQHSNALDDDMLTDMNTRFVVNASIKDAIERRELWWEVVILE